MISGSGSGSCFSCYLISSVSGGMKTHTRLHKQKYLFRKQEIIALEVVVEEVVVVVVLTFFATPGIANLKRYILSFRS